MTSLVSDFDIFCDNNGYRSVIKGLWFLGFVSGAVVFGRIADKIGHVLALYILFTFGAFGTLLTALSPNIQCYCAARFINAVSVGGGGMCVFLLASEITRATWVKWISAIANSLFGLGPMIMALLGFLIPHWRVLSWINFGAHAVYLIPLIPRWKVIESPAWLVSHKQYEKAVKALEDIARGNGRTISSIISAEYFEDDATAMGRVDSWTQLFCHRKLSLSLAILCVVWFTSSGAYYGVSSNAEIFDFGLNVYAMTAFLALIDIPGAIAAAVGLNYCRRKSATWICCIAGGTLSIIVTIKGIAEIKALALVLCLLARFFIIVIMDGLFTYSYELAPDSLRSQFCGILTTVGHLGAGLFTVLCSTIEGLDIPGIQKPIFIFTGVPLALASLAVFFFLTETKGKKLALTVRDL